MAIVQDLTHRLSLLRPIINEICEIGGIPGASIGVAHQGKTVFSDNFGYRDIESSVPPDSNTLYGIASMTKSITASAICILVNEGKLSWTTPIVSIIPELNTVDKYLTGQLVITDLLTHQLGLETSNEWWFGSNGTLLMKKSQAIASFNALKKVGPFRLGTMYSNWNFVLAGEVIERLSGVSYGEFVQSRIFQPLQMDRTTTTKNFQSVDVENFARPYGALDDKSMVLLPPPPVLDGTIMVAAQGVQSSVNDMLKFTNALLAGCKEDGDKDSPLKLSSRQLAGHIFCEKQLIGKSYALGLMRALLPNSIGGGHEIYGKVPTIKSGGSTRIVLYHGGSQAGYTSFMSMLPEADLSVVVLTNSIGFGEPSGWIHELLLETLADSPDKTDFIKLAKGVAANYLRKIPRMLESLEQSREGTPSRPLSEFVGRYSNPNHDFVVVIRQGDDKALEVVFQGLESQAWDLRHHHHDTFTWLPSLNDIIKNALFPHMGQNAYTITFEVEDGTEVKRLLWPHEARLGPEVQYFDKMQDVLEGKEKQALGGI
ncbi:D-aminoacylase [Penicillium malachiteum]|uniref:D-aminoacylase n=1 Tax=Penicillium malachiteum TaxID=1324776 RepID=UPI002547014C|nr:D-aminoacylase [Penicillium malachiteum]KAJ5735752.1 D-aminoacylase [Penicillium malachiteum]